ncbi:MAG: glycoside hydrolase family 127 protein [Proteobacteria bacterium]|nr:glycoside hydrolase family 127 protein [Pseudomonadota bacterium]
MGRRQLLLGAMAGAAGVLVPAIGRTLEVATRRLPRVARPVPLSDVRLLPSRYLDALDANRRYVLSLEADRLLHNFRVSAGLAPRAPAYGGWEGDTIAGHTLGHWLSALSLLHAQTGDAEAARRAGYVVDELAECQRRHGDGYVAGFTRRRGDGSVVDGKEIFTEIMRGDIRAAPFDLNGCWSPLYNWHKLLAGLRDAERWCGLDRAVAVARGLGGFVERVLRALDAAQVERLLGCEHGGISESFADLAERTGEPRWLTLAAQLYHHQVLDPLTSRRDELAGLHANTQIPKVLGLARLGALSGRTEQVAAARFFWEAVTRDHSYIIGGNSDREYFQAPRAVARYLSEQTCEGCNTYNMLKLTRELYGSSPAASYFDFYERAHLNHVLAQQDPSTGAFTYMTPLMAGAAREYSTPFESFWCCVGTGMESHAKHGDSVFWLGDDALFVNLYVPATLDWRDRGAVVELTTRYPHEGAVEVRFARLAEPQEFTVALRKPGWCRHALLRVNGHGVRAVEEAGYLVVSRRWQGGDTLALALDLPLRVEAAPDDTRRAAVLRGPQVLAADLGPDEHPYRGPEPALVAADPLPSVRPVDLAASRFRTVGIGQPQDWDLVPFHDQHRRRSAVYFRHVDAAGWAMLRQADAEAEAQAEALQARSVDGIEFGDAAAEASHGLASAMSYAVSYRGRGGRDARSGGYLEFDLRNASREPVALHVTYWGEERARTFEIRVDGIPIATQHLDHDDPGRFFEVEYPISASLTGRSERLRVRIEPHAGSAAGPLFDCRLVRRRDGTVPR